MKNKKRKRVDTNYLKIFLLISNEHSFQRPYNVTYFFLILSSFDQLLMELRELTRVKVRLENETEMMFKSRNKFKCVVLNKKKIRIMKKTLKKQLALSQQRLLCKFKVLYFNFNRTCSETKDENLGLNPDFRNIMQLSINMN